MHPTRRSLGIIGAGVVLTLYGVMAGSQIALIAAIMIAALLCIRLFSFHRKIKKVISGMTCHRVPSALLLRQGSRLSVTLTLNLALPADMTGEVAERPPAGMLPGGPLPQSGLSPGHTGEVRLEYSLTPALQGAYTFPGLTLFLADNDFSDTFLLGSAPFRGPLVRVYPVGQFEPVSGTLEYGEAEIEQIRAISGSGIRGFRDFVQGDDYRTIDWKLSAKFDRYIVREYYGRTGTEFLLVADIPEGGEEQGSEAYGDMIQALSGAAEQSLRQHHRASLALISGPNVLSTDQVTTMEGAIAVFHAATRPVKRLQTFYRYRTRGDIRVMRGVLARELHQATKETGHGFLSTLSRVSRATLASHHPLAFEGEVARLMRMNATKGAIIFSLCSGDTSHIRFFVDEVHKQQLPVHLWIPRGIRATGPARRYASLGADTVEVF